MEERRVFLNSGRIGSLLLLTVLCAALFLYSQLEQMEPDEFQYMRNTGIYTATLSEKWANEDIAALPEKAVSEDDRLWGFYFWMLKNETLGTPYASEEEAYRDVADLPDVVRLAKEGNTKAVGRLIGAYSRALSELQGEIAHLNSYPAYLENIQKQALLQSQTSIFGTPNTFSYRNLMRTAKEFAVLDGANVQFGNSRGLQKWLDYSLKDYFCVFGIVLFVFAFLEERKKGLWTTIRSCQGGRAKLALHRIGILFAASILCTLLFNFAVLCISMGINGGWQDLGRPLQSMECFSTCTIQTSIAGWLVLYYIVKVLSCLLVGLLLWCVLGTLSNPQFSTGILAVVLGAEYVLYTLLPVQSVFNVLKYCNLFSFVRTSDIYTNYLNINFFGFPVGKRALLMVLLPVCLILFAVWAVIIQKNRYPEGNQDVLGSISQKVNQGMDFFRTRLSCGAWEGYKLLAFGFGAVILVVVSLASQKLAYEVPYPLEKDGWYSAYFEDLQGPLENSDAYFTHAKELSNDDQRNALERLEKEVALLTEQAENGGYDAWLVGEKTYDSFYGSYSRNRQRLNATIAILFVIFLCASIASFENQSGVVKMLRSLKHGRRQLSTMKTVLCVLMAVFVWAVVYLRELQVFRASVDMETFAAPVQSLKSLAIFPLKVTIGQYLSLLYGARLLMLIATSFVVLLISHLSPNIRTAYILSIAILVIPTLLVVLGAEVLKWLSALVPVSAAELLWAMGSGTVLPALGFLVWLAVGIAAMLYYQRLWNQGQ